MNHNPYAPPDSWPVSAMKRAEDTDTSISRMLRWSPLSIGGGTLSGWIFATLVIPGTIQRWQGNAIIGFIFGLCLLAGMALSGMLWESVLRRIVMPLLLLLTFSTAFIVSEAMPTQLLLHLYYSEPWLFALCSTIVPYGIQLLFIGIFLWLAGVLSLKHTFWLVVVGMPIHVVFPGFLGMFNSRVDIHVLWILGVASFHAILLSLLAVWLRPPIESAT